jgi:hypothetical protein
MNEGARRAKKEESNGEAEKELEYREIFWPFDLHH